MAPRRKTEPRKIPKQSRSRELVAAIVEAATRIMTDVGFERMNVNRVAELAGVSVGSLYQYYPSKEAIAGAVAAKLGAQTAAAVAERFEALEALRPRAAIRGAIAIVLHAYRLNPALRRVIRTEVPEAVPHFDTPDIDAELKARVGAYLARFRTHLRPADVDLAMRVVFTTVEAVSETLSDAESEEVMAELSTMLERYLLQDEAGT